MSIDQSRIIDTGMEALAAIDYAINIVAKHQPPNYLNPGPPFCIINEPEMNNALRYIAEYQAIAYACLFNNGKKAASENEELFNLRIERVYNFRRRVGDIDIPNLRKKGVRNALAHLDERMLRNIIERPTASYVIDLAASHKDVLVLEDFVVYIRFYSYHEDSYRLFNEEIKLKPLRKEIDMIVNRCGLRFDTSNRGNF